MHNSGLDAQMQDVVHRLHREGYVTAAPDFFHRQPAGDLTPQQRSQMLRDNEVIADVNATISHLKNMRLTVAPLGIVGFCMGGRISYLLACVQPEFRAAAVFYGGNTMQARDGPSPFERSSSIQCPLLGCFGVEDANPSQDDVKKIDAELTRLKKWHEFHSYNNAGHAFQNFSNPERYRERAARASWTEMLAFFTEYLKRS